MMNTYVWMMNKRLLILLVLPLLIACGVLDGPSQKSPTQNKRSSQPSSLQQTNNFVMDTELSGRLLFVQRGVIWIWSGTQAKPLLGKGESWQPAWSPDGTRIAYVERGESYSNIILSNGQGERIAKTTINDSDLPLQSHERIYDTMWAFYPTWMPSGKRLSISTQYGPPAQTAAMIAMDYNLSIYSLSTSGGSRTFLYGDDEAHCGKMAYRPHSRDNEETQLVFTRSETKPDGVQQLYLLNLDRETEEQQAVPFPGAPVGSYDPAFSPDGKWLAFAQRKNEHTDIWVLPGDPASAKQPRQFTQLGKARSPVFSPDGRMMAFLAIAPQKTGFDLWITDVQIDGNGMIQAVSPRQITHDMSLDADSGLSWAP